MLIEALKLCTCGCILNQSMKILWVRSMVVAVGFLWQVSFSCFSLQADGWHFPILPEQRGNLSQCSSARNTFSFGQRILWLLLVAKVGKEKCWCWHMLCTFTSGLVDRWTCPQPGGRVLRYRQTQLPQCTTPYIRDQLGGLGQGNLSSEWRIRERLTRRNVEKNVEKDCRSCMVETISKGHLLRIILSCTRWSCYTHPCMHTHTYTYDQRCCVQVSFCQNTWILTSPICSSLNSSPHCQSSWLSPSQSNSPPALPSDSA